MTRIFDAVCESSVVRVEGHTIDPTPTIPSQGKKSSTGAYILYEGKAFYLTSNATDIADFLTQMNSALSTIASVLPTIAGATGDLGAIAAAASAAASLNTVASTLNTMKVNLK